MIHAAGILILNKDGQALFLKRGAGGDAPGSWAFPGGRLEASEDAQTAAVRETLEETGHAVDPAALRLWARRIGETTGAAPVAVPPAGNLPPPDADSVTTIEEAVVEAKAPPDNGLAKPTSEQVDFTTFLLSGVETFAPKMNEEHTEYVWAPPGNPPEPLHAGCRPALAKLSPDLDELAIAMLMKAGELTSPQVYENVTLFALRVTGTGAAYRYKFDEYVWRDPSLYLNPEFLARCNGLPVIFEHPKTNVLTSSEFKDRTVGTILLPYIRGNEVWGIAKIYDAAAAEMMANEQLSTSPAVVWRDPDVNNNIELEDGSKFLIEGKPSLLDHLAICERGVWDKGGDPEGVSTTATGDKTMADEKEVPDVKADDGQALDKLLKGIDAMSAKLDSMGSRMDAMEAGGVAKDADIEEIVLEAEPEVLEEIVLEAEEIVPEEGEPIPVVADADEEDKEKERADARADSIMVRKLMREVADLRAKLPRQQDDATYAAYSDTQARYDSVFSAFGKSAPRPLQGESLIAYRRRMLNDLKGHDKSWKNVDLGVVAVDDAAMNLAETQIHASAMLAARSPASVPAGSLRPVSRKLASGHNVTEFMGSPSAWMRRHAPTRQVVTAINLQKAN